MEGGRGAWKTRLTKNGGRPVLDPREMGSSPGAIERWKVLIYTADMALLRTLLIATSVLLSACASPTAPELPPGAIRVNGTVRYFTLEGGFWAVRGDDGVTYDPMNGLASEFRRENLRITMVAKVRNDVGGIHMVGPIVEVISIQPR